MDEIKDNLFVLTSVGQLRNICGFIDQYHAAENAAVVFYTVRNLGVVSNIKKELQGGYFKDVQYVRLPEKLLDESKSKSKVLYQRLENLIRDNGEKYKTKNLFLCMPNAHYSFLEKICKKNNISVNLIEEGLATYRIFLKEKDEKNHKIGAKDLRANVKRIFRSLYKVFASLIELFINLISLITRINILYYIRKLIDKPKKYKYGLISDFDSVYVCYPELMKSLNKHASNVQELKFNYKDEDIKFTSDEDEENILFINQKYGVRYKEHFPIVFSILQDMGGVKKVYFKFHPKEDPETFMEIFDEAKEKFPELEIITLDELSHVPAENLLNTNNITKIIALTSSSLFFSKKVKEDIETISIAEEYKKRCIQFGVIERRMTAFLDDYDNLMRLFPVEQFKSDKDTNSLSKLLEEENGAG